MSTVFTKPITLEKADGVFVFDGCDFTQDAVINIKKAALVKIVNCRFYDLTNPTRNTQVINGSGSECTEFIFEHNYIGPCKRPEGARNYLYDWLNMYIKVSKASVQYNYFSADCCYQNAVNFYIYDDNAELVVSNNIFGDMAHAIRMTNNGAPTGVTVKIENNQYLKLNYAGTDDEIWNVVFLTQPSATTSMGGVHYILTNNKFPKFEGQQQFLYYVGPNDSDPTVETIPMVTIDGVDKTPYEIPYCGRDKIIHYIPEVPNEEEPAPQPEVEQPEQEPEVVPEQPEG